MLLASPAADARAEINITFGGGERRPFVFETRPQFVLVPNFGFSVIVGSQHDVILYDNYYYAFQNGIWYGAGDYRGPWIIVQESRLPSRIRMHRWDEIRRMRDVEYRRHDRRYDGRYDWRDNRRERSDGERRDNGRDNRGDDRRNDGGRRD